MRKNPAPGLHCHIFILGYINKAFPLHSLVTKYGEKMTNALFPFIKAGPTTLSFPIICMHAPYTHLKCVCVCACRQRLPAGPRVLLILAW